MYQISRNKATAPLPCLAMDNSVSALNPTQIDISSLYIYVLLYDSYIPLYAAVWLTFQQLQSIIIIDKDMS